MSINKFFSNPKGIYNKVNWLTKEVKKLINQGQGGGGGGNIPTLQEVVDEGDEADEITLEELVIQQPGPFNTKDIGIKTYDAGYVSIYTKFDQKSFGYRHHTFTYTDDDSHSATFDTTGLTGGRIYDLPDYAGEILLKPLETDFQYISNNPQKGDMRYLTDAANIAYRGIASGGGTDFALILYDGTNWIYH